MRGKREKEKEGGVCIYMVDDDDIIPKEVNQDMDKKDIIRVLFDNEEALELPFLEAEDTVKLLVIKHIEEVTWQRKDLWEYLREKPTAWDYVGLKGAKWGVYFAYLEAATSLKRLRKVLEHVCDCGGDLNQTFAEPGASYYQCGECGQSITKNRASEIA